MTGPPRLLLTQPALHLLGLAELTAQAAETISDARKAVDGDHYARAIEVAGPVQITGSDPHGLDRDNEGVACE